MKNDDLQAAKAHFIQGVSDIVQFWGFPRQMGTLYGTVYLSPAPLTLVEIGQEMNVLPDSLLPHLHMLTRLGMLYEEQETSNIPPTYHAETDFWKTVRTVLQEREKKEFAAALHRVEESMEMAAGAAAPADTANLAAFYQERMGNLHTFLDMLNQILGTMMSLDEMRLQALLRFFGKSNPLRARSSKKPPTPADNSPQQPES